MRRTDIDDAAAASGRILIRAAAVIDGAGRRAAPGAVLLEGRRILASGTPASIGDAADAVRDDRPRSVVIPALVNAHAHLDLTHLGLVPFHGCFIAWLDALRARRAPVPAEIRDSARAGAELAIAGGTALAGDIAGAGSVEPLEGMRAAGLPGIGFVELFGRGSRAAAAIERAKAVVAQEPRSSRGVRLGLQPHAPYSAGPDVYAAAASLGVPCATHVAESLEELQFVRSGDGPIADMLARFGVHEPDAPPGRAHPVDLLADVLSAHPFVAAHLNYVDDEHVTRLASWPVSVVYCPRASAYFGHPREGRPAHRYRAMRAAGVNVALGTDGLLCLDTPDRISVLDEMRLLFRRDAVDPGDLIEMATVAGARALGADPDAFTLAPGPTAGLVAIEVDVEAGAAARDPVASMLHGRAAPSWVLRPPPDEWGWS